MTTQTKTKTTQPEMFSSPLKDAEESFLTAFRGGMGAVEKAGLSAMEIPLTVLSSLGVPEETTTSARKAGVTMADGITEAIDSIATGSLKVADQGLSLVTGVFAGATKS
jgi:hypothetical protein